MFYQGVPHAPVRTPGLSPREEQVRGWAPRPAGLLALWEVREGFAHQLLPASLALGAPTEAWHAAVPHVSLHHTRLPPPGCPGGVGLWPPLTEGP